MSFGVKAMKNTKEEIDVVFVDARTMKRIKSAREAMNNATTEWGHKYWAEVIQKLIASCEEEKTVVH